MIIERNDVTESDEGVERNGGVGDLVCIAMSECVYACVMCKWQTPGVWGRENWQRISERWAKNRASWGFFWGVDDVQKNYGNDLKWQCVCVCMKKIVFIHWTKEDERVQDGAKNSWGNKLSFWIHIQYVAFLTYMFTFGNIDEVQKECRCTVWRSIIKNEWFCGFLQSRLYSTLQLCPKNTATHTTFSFIYRVAFICLIRAVACWQI